MHRPRLKPFRLVLVVGVVASALFFLLQPVAPLAAQGVYDAVGLLAALAMLWGVRLHRPEDPWPWFLFAGGTFAFFIGDSIWTIYEMLGLDPWPSIADAAYLSGYPLLGGGLLRMVRNRLPGRDMGSLVDAVILATAGGVVAWVYLMQPYAADHSLSSLEVVTSLAYPIGDVVLLGLVARLVFSPGRRPPAFHLVSAAVVVLLGADLLYGWLSVEGLYRSGQPVDALWLGSYVAWAAAAVHPSMRVVDERTEDHSRLTNFRLTVLALATVLAPLLLLRRAGSGQAGLLAVLAVAAAVMPLLVILRLVTLTREVSEAALRDSLTGLPNRRVLMNHLEGALARDRAATAVLFVDLDRFKVVNDTLGHGAGDELLIGVSQRLRSCVRESDVVCRLGGDEFVVLCRVDGEPAARTLATRIGDSLKEPLWIGGAPVFFSASIGIAMPSNGERAEDLVQAADAAMYRAKQRGKACYEMATA